MWPISERLQQAFRDGYSREWSATLHLPPSSAVAAVPLITDASLTCSQQRRVRWDGSMSFAPTNAAGADITALTDPRRGAWVQPQITARFTDGSTEAVPLPPLLITDQRVSGFGDVECLVSSREQYVEDNRLIAPSLYPQGVTRARAIAQWYADSLPAGVPAGSLVDLSGSTTASPRAVVERDRGDALTDLATSMGCEWFVDRRGNPVVRKVPTTDTPAVWLLDQSASGVLISAVSTRSRSNLYNAVSAAGTDVPVRAVAYDTNPNSQTRYGGPIGKKVRFYASPALRTTAQCDSAARSILSRVLGQRSSMALTGIPNFALDAGDVVEVLTVGSSSVRHIVDALSIDFDPTREQPLSTRASDIPDES